MANEDLENDLYKNWVRGAKGLEYLQEGLQDFVQDKVLQCRDQTLRQTIQKLPTGSPHHCNQCTSQNLLPEHAKKQGCKRSTCIALFPNNCFGSKPNGRRKCPNGICSKLYDAIVLDHSSRDPLWKNTDPSTWCSDPDGWSFGKCFQTTTGPGISASETDAAGLLSILINNLTIQNTWLACNDMSSKTACPFNRARDIRNAVLHSSKLELDDPTLGYYYDTFITVLQDANCLFNFNGSKRAVDKLSQLRNKQINISLKDEMRLVKIRKEALSELEERTSELLNEISGTTAYALSGIKKDAENRTNTALLDIEQARSTAIHKVKEEKRTALCDLEEAKKRVEQEVEDNTKYFLSEIKQVRRGTAQDINESAKRGLSDIDKARKDAEHGVKESTKDALSELAEAKEGSTDHIKKRRNDAFLDIEEAKNGALHDVKESTKTALSKIAGAERWVADHIKENTNETLAELNKAIGQAERCVTESTNNALSDIKVSRVKAEQKVKEKTNAALSDLEEARVCAGQDFVKRKQSFLSEIEVAKSDAIDQLKEHQPTVVMSGGVKSAALLSCNPTSAVVSDESENVATEQLGILQSIFKMTRMRRLKKVLKEDLILLYRQQYHTLPLSPLIEERDTPLLKFYAMPDINSVETQKPFGAGNEIKSKVTSLRELFYRKNAMCREIYITADAGFGKTAYSKRLVLTWCQSKRRIRCEQKYFKEEDIDAMSEFKFVFLLSLRDCTGECDIDEMIAKKIIPRLAHTSVTVSNIESILSKEKCLVILDGLDEWTHPAPTCKLGPSDIPHRKARECTILTTTRPWKLSVLNLSSSQIDKRLELVGLGKTSAKSLKRSVISLLSGDTGIEQKIQNFESTIRAKDISGLQNIPLILMYLLCLWFDEIDLGNSTCELYCQIVELLLKRTFKKYPHMQYSRRNVLSGIPKCVDKHEYCKTHFAFLTALGKLAFQTLFSETNETKLSFDSMIAAQCLNRDYLDLSRLSGILTQGLEQKKLTKQIQKTSFSHKTMQEFLAAIHISISTDQENMQTKVISLCNSVADILEMSKVFIFISGINANLFSLISKDLMKVISKDKITSIYRTMTFPPDYYKYDQPLKGIQNMSVSCVKQNAEKSNLKFSLQDVIIEDCHQTDYVTNLQQLVFYNKNNIESIRIVNKGSLWDIIDMFGLGDLGNIQKIYYRGECNEKDIIRLLLRSLKCVTIVSSEWRDDTFIAKVSSFSNELSKAFQNMFLLQVIHIDSFKMSHDTLEELMNFIRDRHSMKEITFWNIFCTDHDASCSGINLDLSRHSNLTSLGLSKIPLSHLDINLSSLEDCRVGRLSKPGLLTKFFRHIIDCAKASKLRRFWCYSLQSRSDIEIMLQISFLVQIQDIRLIGINLGDKSLSLSPDGVNIEYIVFIRVSMSASALRVIVQLLEKLPQAVLVELQNCNITPKTEFENVKQYLERSSRFIVTSNVLINRVSGFVFRFQTTEIEKRSEI